MYWIPRALLECLHQCMAYSHPWFHYVCLSFLPSHHFSRINPKIKAIQVAAAIHTIHSFFKKNGVTVSGKYKWSMRLSLHCVSLCLSHLTLFLSIRGKSETERMEYWEFSNRNFFFFWWRRDLKDINLRLLFIWIYNPSHVHFHLNCY